MSSLLKHRPALIAAIVFVLAFDVAFLWQHVEGANISEFGGHPDEAAHYVTGLMVHDYVAARFPGAPVKFAEEYYAHYPKIGLGVWPPVFYIVQTAWTLPLGVSRQSVMLLMCALAATDALLLYVALRRDFGPAPASMAALIFVSLPVVREYYGMVMAETLSTAFIFGATLAFGNFLDREKARDAVLFGLLAGLAILTKGTGLALALMALLALVFTRKWHLLARPALWIAAGLTAVLAGPWTWKFKDMGKGGWEQPAPSLAWSREAFLFFLGKFGSSLGLVLLLLFCLGRFGEIARPAGESAGCGRLIRIGRRQVGRLRRPHPGGGDFSFDLSRVHRDAASHPGASGGDGLCHRGPDALPARHFRALPRIRRQGMTARRASGSHSIATVVVGGFIVLAAAMLPISSKRDSGFGRLAVTALRQADPHDAMLISSDAIGEGMFIAEVALRDPHRPNYVIKRSSKELASSEWNGSHYREKYESDTALRDFLISGKIHFLVEDESMPENKRKPHHDTLKRVLAADTKYFWEIGTSAVWRNGEEEPIPARLFRIEPLPLERKNRAETK